MKRTSAKGARCYNQTAEVCLLRSDGMWMEKAVVLALEGLTRGAVTSSSQASLGSRARN